MQSIHAKWFTLGLIVVALVLWGATYWQSHDNGKNIIRIERIIGAEGPRGRVGPQGIQGTTICPVGYHFSLATLSEETSGHHIVALVCIPNR